MKTRPDKSWFHWSDGRPFSRDEWRRMALVLKKQKQPGESFKARFTRCRAVVEKYETTKARIIATEPGMIRKAWNWLAGRPSMVKVELK